MDLMERGRDLVDDLIGIAISAVVCIVMIQALAQVIVSGMLGVVDLDPSGLVVTVITVAIVAYLNRDSGFTVGDLKDEHGVKGIIGLMIAHLFLGNIPLALLTPVLFIAVRAVSDRMSSSSSSDAIDGL